MEFFDSIEGLNTPCLVTEIIKLLHKSTYSSSTFAEYKTLYDSYYNSVIQCEVNYIRDAQLTI